MTDQPETCEWVIDRDKDSAHSTSCGHLFQFTEGGPLANGFRFCGYCGKPLVEFVTRSYTVYPTNDR